jgi:uncharacterized protein YndB with AHSA1/START domain
VEKIGVQRSIWIDAPIEETWQAVTDPAKLGEWYAPGSPWKIPELRLGAAVEFHHSPNRHHTATEVSVLNAAIISLEPPREFSLQWEPDKTYPDLVLVTTFRLVEENGGTRATIHESGYEGIPREERQEWLDSISSGYGMSIENLKALVEGREVPHK